MTPLEFIEKIPKELRLSPLGCCKSLHEVVLDPKVWEAVGKSLNWGIDEWKTKMIGLTHHLIKGGTIESYLETL